MAFITKKSRGNYGTKGIISAKSVFENYTIKFDNMLNYNFKIEVDKVKQLFIFLLFLWIRVNIYSAEDDKPNILFVLMEDLGIARVRLNGKDLDVIWAKPFEVDVTNILQKGQNALEISVVNSWRNRLLGDEKLPAEKRLTKTNIQVKKEWQLLDAGLLGPVQILEQQD